MASVRWSESHRVDKREIYVQSKSINFYKKSSSIYNWTFLQLLQYEVEIWLPNFEITIANYPLQSWYIQPGLEWA